MTCISEPNVPPRLSDPEPERRNPDDEADAALREIVADHILNRMLGTGEPGSKGPLTVEIEAIVDERVERILKPVLARLDALERRLERARAKEYQAAQMLAAFYRGEVAPPAPPSEQST